MSCRCEVMGRRISISCHTTLQPAIGLISLYSSRRETLRVRGSGLRQEVRQLQRQEEAHARPHHRQAVLLHLQRLRQDLHSPVLLEKAPQGAWDRGVSYKLRQRGGGHEFNSINISRSDAFRVQAASKSPLWVGGSGGLGSDHLQQILAALHLNLQSTKADPFPPPLPSILDNSC